MIARGSNIRKRALRTHDGTVGESLGESAGNEDHIGEDDGPLPAVLFSEGQLDTGSEERTSLEEGDHVGFLGCGLLLGHLVQAQAELFLERRQGEGTTEETSVVYRVGLWSVRAWQRIPLELLTTVGSGSHTHDDGNQVSPEVVDLTGLRYL